MGQLLSRPQGDKKRLTLDYTPGVKWEDQASPRPTFWMHQLAGVDPKLLLCADPTRLSVEVAKLLDDSKEGPYGD